MKCEMCLNILNYSCSCTDNNSSSNEENYEVLLLNDQLRCISICSQCPRNDCHISFYLHNNNNNNNHSDECNCPKLTHKIENGICLPKNQLISAEKLRSYSTIETINDDFISQFIYDSIRPAIYNCHQQYNQSACQYLINLCTVAYIGKMQNIIVNDYDICNELENIEQIMNFDINIDKPTETNQAHNSNSHYYYHTNDVINLIQFRLNLNGSLNKYQSIYLNELFYCHNQVFNHKYLLFGVHFAKKCRWNSKNMKEFFDSFQDQKDYFYQLFILSSDNRLYPIIFNYNDNDDDQQFVVKNLNRFFLANSKIFESKFIVYAKNVELNVIIDDHESNVKTLHIEINIDYRRLSIHDDQDNIQTEFIVNYRINNENDSIIDFNIFLITFSLLLSIIWSSFRTWTSMNRCNDIDYDRIRIINTSFIFLNYIIISFSNIVAFMLFVFILNRILLYKFQSVKRTLLFNIETQLQFYYYFCIIFVCKLIEIIKRLYEITSFTLFFIDWENPKQQLQNDSDSTNNKRKISPRLSDNISKDSTRKMKNGSLNNNNVIIWRNILIINEWLKLSTKRRLNIELHLILLSLILNMEMFKKFYKSSPQSHLNSLQNDQEYLNEIQDSFLIRIITTISIYLLLILIQYFYVKIFKENFIYNQFNEFIDLCSICNISVFCLHYKKYGYYIHGISPHGHSDVNMLEMYRQLDMEEYDLCSKRGLSPNTDNQIFEIYLPIIMYDNLNEYYSNLHQPIHQQQIKSKEKLQINSDKSRLVSTYVQINNYLINFIAHMLDKADYRIQDKTSMESMFDYESASVSQGIGYFYNDSNYQFENVLFFGIETSTLIIFELIIFIMIDFFTENFFIDSLLTYLISIFIQNLYKKFYRKNLIEKTLIDERFVF